MAHHICFIRRRFLLAMAAMSSGLFSGGCALQVGYAPSMPFAYAPAPSQPAAPAPDVPGVSPELSTQVFESGQYKITDVSSAYLEAFLQDLNRRKDYDYSCHNGQPGPDAPYLWQWVMTVTTELQRRGYYFDNQGDLHRPGTAVALR